MISISDATRNVMFQEQKDFNIPKTIRGSLHKTLDGGAFIFHSGAQAGGNEFNIIAVLSDADAATIESIYTDSTEIYISTRYGAFKGTIAAFKNTYGKIELTIWTSGEG